MISGWSLAKTIYNREEIANPEYRLPKRFDYYEDELLSSYLSRVAIMYGVSPRTFAETLLQAVKGRTAVSQRDMDSSIDDERLRFLAYKTRTTYEELFSLTLRSFTGILYEEIKIHGATPFLERFRMEGGIPQRSGIKVCPDCMREKLYFRKLWRLAFYNVCHIHRKELLPYCPKCNSPFRVFSSHSHEFGTCFKCGTPVQELTSKTYEENAPEVKAVRTFIKVIEQGAFITGDSQVIYPLSFFKGLRLICNFVVRSMKSRGEKVPDINLEFLPFELKLRIFTTAYEWLKNYPYSFRERFKESKIGVRYALSGIHESGLGEKATVPYFIAKELREFYPSEDAQLSTEEGLKSAVFALLKAGVPPKIYELSKYTTQTLFDKAHWLLKALIDYYTPELPEKIEGFVKRNNKVDVYSILEEFKEQKVDDVIRVLNYLLKERRLKIVEGGEILNLEFLDPKKLRGPIKKFGSDRKGLLKLKKVVVGV